MSKIPKVGEKVVIIDAENSGGFYKNGDTAKVIPDDDPIESGIEVVFDNRFKENGDPLKFFLYHSEYKIISNKRKENQMKNVNELRIPAYAVVELTTNRAMQPLLSDRQSARVFLQKMKELNPEYRFKLVKLTAEKFIR
ncbi:MAG: hypothetical protein ACRCVU_20280 [Flavobacterium sp.]